MEVVIAGINDIPCDNVFFLVNVFFNLEENSSKDAVDIENQIRSVTATKSQDRLKRLLPDDSSWGLVVSKALSFNPNFSFINRISLLLIPSS